MHGFGVYFYDKKLSVIGKESQGSRRGDVYRGYFKDNLRSGPGEFWYRHDKGTTNTKEGRKAQEAEKGMQYYYGPWFEGKRDTDREVKRAYTIANDSVMKQYSAKMKKIGKTFTKHDLVQN